MKQNRDGFVMGEGAGVLLLEELEHAKVALASFLLMFDFLFLFILFYFSGMLKALMLNKFCTLFMTLQNRGANIYAEFLGGSFTCDAYHMTEPRPDGIVFILIFTL